VMGRLKPGVAVEQVRGNLEGAFQQTARAGMQAYMNGLTEQARGLENNRQRGDAVPALLASSAARGIYDFDNNSARAASTLAVVVVLVLLIVCANVANLLLSRATTRQKELSVRLSVGATRGRLIRQLLTESFVLAALGGAGGLLVGFACRGLLPFGQNVSFDWRVFGFVSALCLLTSFAFGLAPALRATRIDLAHAMKEQGRGTTGGRSRLSRGLLIVQVALSLVLLAGAGLFLQTVSNLRAVDVGFNANNLLMFSVDPTLNGYEPDRTRQVYRDLDRELRALPGVSSVAFTRVVLLSGATSTTGAFIAGQPKPIAVHIMTVTPAFFSTMEIRFVGGRDVSDRDVDGAPKVAVINEAAARILYPEGGNPIGRRFGFEQEKDGEVEIVGLVRDARYNSLRDPPPPTVYTPAAQNPPRALSAVVRTANDPAGTIAAAREAVRRVDTTLPIANLTTQVDLIERRFAQERLFATAYATFGVVALALASIGLFGLMSYSVSRRTNEIGLRLALGADSRRVARMVVSESMLLVVIGVALGLVAAIASGRLVTSMLFGLAPRDPLTLGLTVALILVVSAFAAYLPARRAAHIDPMVALRAE